MTIIVDMGLDDGRSCSDDYGDGSCDRAHEQRENFAVEPFSEEYRATVDHYSVADICQLLKVSLMLLRCTVVTRFQKY